MKRTFGFLLLLFPLIASAQIKIFTVTDETTPASAEVMKSLRQELSAHPKQFQLVGQANPDLIVQADCIPRQTTEPYVCFYTANYAGTVSKTMLGGGIYAAKTSANVALNFLSSIAQDIAERWNSTIRSNAIDTLESCLFLTQSSCAVPATLVPELKVKTLNLSQYLQKGGLKK